MEATFSTANRKELVKAIEKITDKKAKYQGPPTFAYQIGEFGINKAGAVTCDDEEALELLIESLAFEGFLTKDSAGLTISMPKDKFTPEVMENFKNMVEAKGELLRQALGADSLPIIEEDDKVTFPWFSEATDTDAYLQLITKMTEMAENQKRISAKPKEIVNAKYEFRCFLLRLGFIGDEYKDARKVLLKNLTGSSAFKNGSRKEAADELSK